MKKTLIKRLGLLLVVAAVAYGGRYFLGGDTGDDSGGATTVAPVASPAAGAASTATPARTAPRSVTAPAAGRGAVQTPTSGDALIAELIDTETSGVMVESSARVTKILPDDEEGSRHQRFIIRIASGETLLVAHNIDLAPRVPISVNDTIEFKGQYEWNDRGGVLHWTHHDPAGRHDGGWLKLNGKLYE